MTSFLETANGRFIAGGEDDLDQLFERLGDAAQPKLLFYVHGGLVTDNSARSRNALGRFARHPANQYAKEIERAGNLVGSKAAGSAVCR